MVTTRASITTMVKVKRGSKAMVITTIGNTVMAKLITETKRELISKTMKKITSTTAESAILISDD